MSLYVYSVVLAHCEPSKFRLLEYTRNINHV
nr:MAG TPA: hypothetical protein [Caudoviricetes sp.]DAK20871.1 MAG TPA: hypothetical protein [Caudoviricetes sp.]DAP56824.1 MAG TPA: hypothetical protein [Caudoviricetes sp.]